MEYSIFYFAGDYLVVLLWQNVRDVIPWVSVEALLQALLIHVMSNKTNAASQHEQGIDCANVDVLLSFLAESLTQNN